MIEGLGELILQVLNCGGAGWHWKPQAMVRAMGWKEMDQTEINLRVELEVAVGATG